MRIFDCFCFFNELDLLEIRLNVMDKYVDYFVIVESRKSFTLKDKPYNYEENKHLLSKFQHKIIYLKIDFEGQGSAWGYEFEQRNSIQKALIRSGAKLHDLVIISDIDEIPNLEGFDFNKVNDDIWTFKMQYYYYFLNHKMNVEQHIIKCCNFKHLLSMTCQDIRAYQTSFKWDKMGWHFSYLGGAEKIKYKIDSFSHQEMNKKEFTGNIEERIAKGIDLFDRDYKFETVEIDSSFPEYIRGNKEKLKDLIK